MFWLLGYLPMRRQPLIDYLRFSEAEGIGEGAEGRPFGRLLGALVSFKENKEYDTETVACTTSLHQDRKACRVLCLLQVHVQVPKDKRMTFDDRHKQCAEGESESSPDRREYFP